MTKRPRTGARPAMSAKHGAAPARPTCLVSSTLSLTGRCVAGGVVSKRREQRVEPLEVLVSFSGRVKQQLAFPVQQTAIDVGFPAVERLQRPPRAHVPEPPTNQRQFLRLLRTHG